jgi:hypothetical protein
MKRSSSFLFVALFLMFPALYWSWGAKSTPIEYLADRWNSYATITWWVIGILLACAVIDWFLTNLVTATVEKTRKECQAERDEGTKEYDGGYRVSRG